MHTLESTIVMTTVIACIFGCIFMEIDFFEQNMAVRKLKQTAVEKERLLKEPYGDEHTGMIGIKDLTKGRYGALMSLLRHPLGDYEEREGEAVFYSLDDPVESIRLTDQTIELLLEMKRGY